MGSTHVVNSLVTGGDTAVYNALVEAEKNLETINGRKSIIVLTALAIPLLLLALPFLVNYALNAYQSIKSAKLKRDDSFKPSLWIG